MRAPFSLALASLSLAACHLAHERPHLVAPDAGPGRADASLVDAAIAPADAFSPIDAAPPNDAAMCAAQSASPVPIVVARIAELFLWRWTGVSCVEERYRTERSAMTGRGTFPPTGCTGASCASLFEHESDCAEAYAACGARVELPRRGPAFSREATADIACGARQCRVSEGCYFGVTPGCGPRERGWGAGLDCDDDDDCGAGARCCVTDDGPYVVATCRATCPPTEARSCLGDAACASGEHCCEALAHQLSVRTSVGVCTPRPCDPESPVDL